MNISECQNVKCLHIPGAQENKAQHTYRTSSSFRKTGKFKSILFVSTTFSSRKVAVLNTFEDFEMQAAYVAIDTQMILCFVFQRISF